MKKLAAAFNHIMGDQFGVCIGIFNYAWSVRGFQLGLLNHVKSKRKGLRWLPIFNTSFQARYTLLIKKSLLLNYLQELF